MRIAIVGAGGVGGYFAGVLARAGHDVHLLARGDHLAAIRTRGLEVATPGDRFLVPLPATNRAEELGEPELAVVAVKAYSLADVAPALALLADRGAAILPLLNGVDVPERLERLGVPAPAILGGVTYISALRVEPARIERRSPFARVLVGELAGGRSERAGAAAAAFAEAGVEARESPEIRLEMWRKFVFLVAVSAACGLAHAGMGAVREPPLRGELLLPALREVIAVAHARGVDLPSGEEERVLTLVDSFGPEIRPSFLADVEAGGPTELDLLSGTVVRVGHESGVVTPLHERVVEELGTGT